MMENKQEVERVREKIRDVISPACNSMACSALNAGADITDCMAYCNKVLDQILAIPELCIKADDQSLPETPPYHEFNAVTKYERTGGYKKAQQDMPKPDKDGSVWVKVLDN